MNAEDWARLLDLAGKCYLGLRIVIILIAAVLGVLLFSAYREGRRGGHWLVFAFLLWCPQVQAQWTTGTVTLHNGTDALAHIYGVEE